MDSNVSKFLTEKKPLKPKKSFLVSLLNKILICFILVLMTLIFMKTNSTFHDFVSKKIFKDNLSFAYLNNLYNKYLGDILPSYKSVETEEVFNEKLTYKSANAYYDGYKLEVGESYLVPILESGIVVFQGEMENYGYTIIIEGIDGVDVWYGNLKNPNVKLYDYVTKGDYLGETTNSSLYLVFEKNQEYLKIEDYLKD